MSYQAGTPYLPQNTAHSHDLHHSSYQGSGAVSAITVGFEARREFWAYILGHGVHPAVRVAHGGPEIVLTAIDQWNKNIKSDSRLYDTFADAAPELAIHLGRYGLPAIVVEAAGAVGRMGDKYYLTGEELTNMLIEGKIDARAYNFTMQNKAFGEVLQAPSWLLHGAEGLASKAIKAGGSYVSQAFQATKANVQSWLHKKVDPFLNSRQFIDMDQALLSLDFVDHVKQTQAEYGLTDQEAAFYIPLAHDSFQKMCRLDENGLLSFTEMGQGSFASTSSGFDLKTELDMDRPRFVEQVPGMCCEGANLDPAMIADLECQIGGLEGLISSGQEVTAEKIEKLEQFIGGFSALQKQQEAEQRKQAKQVHAYRVAETAFGALEQFQRQETAEMMQRHANKMEARAIDDRRAREEQRKTWLSLMSNRVTLGEWIHTESLKTFEGLQDYLTDLKREYGAYQGKSDELQGKIDENIKRQQELARKKRKRGGWKKLLRGAGAVLKVGAVLAAPLPPLSAGLAAGAAAVGAGSAAIDNRDMKKQLQNQEKGATLENQIQKDSYSQEQLNQEQQRLNVEVDQLLTDIVEGKYGAPPWVRRAALQEKISRLDQKLAMKAPKDKDSAEYLIWSENQKKLKAAKENTEERLRNEEQVAHISDRSWRVAEYWGNVWSSSDEETARFGRAMEEAVDSYFKATTKERWAMFQTLNAFEMLGAVTGSSWLNQGARMGQQAYFLLDMGRYAYTTAIPNLIDAWKAPTNFVGSLGGFSTLLSAYLAPAVGVVTSAIMLYRMATSGQQGPSPQEQMFHHLNNQLNRLHETLGEIAKSMQQQNGALYEAIQESQKVVKQSQMAIQNDLKKGFEKARKERVKQEFRQVTRGLKQRRSELQSKRTLFNESRKSEKSISQFLAYLSTDIQTSTEDIRSGALHSLRGKDLNSIPFTRLIAENPDFYTGMLAGLTDGSFESLPNLRDFLEHVISYSAVKERMPLSLQGKLKQILHLLSESGNRLNDFYSSFPSICAQAFEQQRATISEVQNQIKEVLSGEEAFRMELLKANFNGLVGRYGERRVGTARNGLFILLKSKNEWQIALPPRGELLAAGREKLPRWKDFTKVMTIGAPACITWTNALAAAALGVIGVVTAPVSVPVIVATAGGATIFGGLAAAGAAAERVDRKSEFDRLERIVGPKLRPILSEIDNTSPIHVLESEKKRLGKVMAFDCTAGDLKVDVVARGRLCDLHAVRAVYNPLEGGFTTQELWSKRVEGISVVQLRFFYDDYRYEVHCQAKVADSFPLSSDDRDRIPESNPVASISKKSVTTYQSWLTKKKGSSGNFLKTSRASVEAFPCENGQTVPLVLPKRRLRGLEVEQRRLAAKGFVMSPRYQFKYSELNQGYRLSFHWGVYKNGEYLGDRAQLDVALFDRRTVEAYGAIRIDERGLSQEAPHLDEFLLTAHFGSRWKEGIGLPGEKTVTVDNGRLIAPVDEPFPGVFALVRQHGREVRFNSATYNGDPVSSQVLGHPLKVEWLPVDGIEEGQCKIARKSYKRYCRIFHAATAVGTTIMKYKPNDIRAFLGRAGVQLPDQGSGEELVEFVARNPTLETLEFPVEKMAEQFEALSQPSKEKCQLHASLQILKA